MTTGFWDTRWNIYLSEQFAMHASILMNNGVPYKILSLRVHVHVFIKGSSLASRIVYISIRISYLNLAHVFKMG